jgi:hypothetical protein
LAIGETQFFNAKKPLPLDPNFAFENRNRAGFGHRPDEGGAVNFCRRFASFESEHARISPVKDVFRPY